MPDEMPGPPAEGAGTSETAPAPEPWAPVLDRVDQLASTVGEMQSGFQSFLQAQQPEPEPEPDPWAALFGEPEPEQYQEPQPQGIDPQAFQQAVNAAIQQANQPLVERLQNYELQQAENRLYERIPALKPLDPGDPNYAANEATRKQTGQLVAASLQNYPQQVAQALMNDPNYIATIFEAAEAKKLAAGQAPASEQIPAVEAAGGAVPSGDGRPPDYIQAAHAARWGGLPPGLR